MKRSRMLGRVVLVLVMARAAMSAPAAEMLDVFVQLVPEPAQQVSAVTRAAAEAPHRARIRALSEQLRDLDRAQRPEVPLDEAGERRALAAMQAARTPEQRQQADDIRRELDFQKDLLRAAVAQSTRRDVTAARAPVTAEIVRLGGVVRPRTLASGIAASIPVTALDELARHVRVSRVAYDPPTDYELDVSVPSAQYDAWWNDPAAIDGGLFDFGIVDSGVQQDHPAFASVTFYTDSATPTDSDPTAGHGTHVTGIVASADATYTGGAFGLDSIIWTNSSGLQSGTMSGMDWLVTGPVQTPEVVNHSLGYGSTNGSDYGTNDSFYDAFVETFDVMVTKSAGNSGWSDVDPTLTFPGTAYNILTIANMDDLNTVSRADDVRRASSSVGPTEGGRRKPDITAPGTNILSTNSGWSASDDFVSMSGTSMAAPHVAAAIVLMEDGGNNVPLAQKAVLINTADAWTSNDTQATSDDGPVTGSHWDKSYGWGYLDMWEAHFNRADYFTGSLVANDFSADDDDYKLYAGPIFSGEKATLVWEKRATTYVAGAPATGLHALSDLDLFLFDAADGSVLDSDTTDPDNVQQVAASANGNAVVKVEMFSSTIEGAALEPFALATEENFAAVSPPSFSRDLLRPTWVGPAQTFDVTVTVNNTGGVASHQTTATLSNIAGISGGGAQALGTIAAAGNAMHLYSLTTSGLVAGSHVLPLAVTSTSYGETYTLASDVDLDVETTAPTSLCTASGTVTATPISVPFLAADLETGVATSDLWVKTPGAGAFADTGLTLTGDSGSFVYVASAGNGDYEFAVRSLDVGGNQESAPTSADCVVTLPEPGAVLSLAAGLGLLGALDRRRRAERASA